MGNVNWVSQLTIHTLLMAARRFWRAFSSTDWMDCGQCSFRNTFLLKLEDVWSLRRVLVPCDTPLQLRQQSSGFHSCSVPTRLSAVFFQLKILVVAKTLLLAAGLKHKLALMVLSAGPLVHVREMGRWLIASHSSNEYCIIHGTLESTMYGSLPTNSIHSFVYNSSSHNPYESIGIDTQFMRSTLQGPRCA